MAELIGDESIYLRLTQLKKGLVRFTDATNAQRLFREHGKDIRYNAAWKKWIVWNEKHWETGLYPVWQTRLSNPP
jgi:putative DNA primase/helicase